MATLLGTALMAGQASKRFLGIDEDFGSGDAGQESAHLVRVADVSATAEYTLSFRNNSKYLYRLRPLLFFSTFVSSCCGRHPVSFSSFSTNVHLLHSAFFADVQLCLTSDKLPCTTEPHQRLTSGSFHIHTNAYTNAQKSTLCLPTPGHRATTKLD